MYRIIGFALFMSLISCTKEIINSKNYDYTIPPITGDNIPVRDVHLYNLDTTLLTKLTKNLIDEAIYNVHSVLYTKMAPCFMKNIYAA
jgi:hypothetical protein